MIWIVLGILALPTLVYVVFMSPWSQLFGQYPYRKKTSEKIVALTFDDGPNEPYTSELLAILKKEKVPATFFLVGRCLERHPSIAADILKAGHVIGNHSESHRFGTYFKPGAFGREVRNTQRILEAQTGITTALVRTPWLWRQPLLLRTVKSLGLHPVAGVFCHPREVFGATAEEIAERSFSKTTPGSILIFHDGKEGDGGNRSQTIQAVAQLIPRLKQKGYKFTTVDKLLGIEPYQHANNSSE